MKYKQDNLHVGFFLRILTFEGYLSQNSTLKNFLARRNFYETNIKRFFSKTLPRGKSLGGICLSKSA